MTLIRKLATPMFYLLQKSGVYHETIESLNEFMTENSGRIIKW